MGFGIEVLFDEDMMEVHMKKHRKVSAGVAGLLLMAAGSASAAWYKVKIVQVVPRTNSGDVVVQLKPGSGETHFTGRVRGLIPGTEAGANKIMAVMLSAVAMNTEVTVEMAKVPAWSSAQVITGAGLIAP